MNGAKDDASQIPARPTFAEATRFWLKLGFISFGGPTGQIAIMHAELVEKKKWIRCVIFLNRAWRVSQARRWRRTIYSKPTPISAASRAGSRCPISRRARN